MGDRPGDGDNAPRAPLVELFRLGSTYRWQVVHTEKQQSVAEHSHMVAVLTTWFCHILGLPPEEYVLHAIFHDAEEAWIGDVATPAKRLMDKSKIPVSDMLGPFARYYNPINLTVKKVVKIADDVEALRFLVRYTSTTHGKQVYDKITARLNDSLRTLEVDAEPMVQLQICILKYITGDGETFADDYI